MYTSIHIHVHVYICTYYRTCIPVYLYFEGSIYACTCTCTCTLMHVHVVIYIHGFHRLEVRVQQLEDEIAKAKKASEQVIATMVGKLTCT